MMEIGKTYKVNHERKGTFVGKLKTKGDEFLTFEIMEGQTTVNRPENEKHVGQDVIVRESFCKLSEMNNESRLDN